MPTALERSCPRCTYPLQTREGPGLQIDRCPRCRGFFLDPGETAQLYGLSAEPASWVHSEVASSRGRSRLSCPAGHGSMEIFRLSHGEVALDVDVCRQCKGLWLDASEDRHLVEIVNAFHNDKSAQLQAESNAGGAKTYIFQLLTGLPREVYNPVRRRAWLVYLTLLALVGLFAWEFVAGVPAVLQLALVPARLWRGEQVWGLFTNVLMHANIVHLLGNLYFLWIFGDNIEDRLGRLGFLLVFWAAALTGGLLHAAVNYADMTPCIGASGGVAGLMGAYLLLFPRVKVWVVFIFVRFKLRVIWYLGIWIGYQLVMARLDVPAVAWYAHIGGFGAGLLLALVLGRALRRTPQLVGRS